MICKRCEREIGFEENVYSVCKECATRKVDELNKDALIAELTEALEEAQETLCVFQTLETRKSVKHILNHKLNIIENAIAKAKGEMK